jgi:HlyD family secretion protein
MPFRPGMSASVDINTHTERNTIAIPIQAVTTREKDEDKESDDDPIKAVNEDEIQEVVFIMSGDTASMVNVETGIQDNEYIQILTGLTVDQVVITGPYSTVSRKLKNGLEVVEKKEEEEKGKKDKE